MYQYISRGKEYSIPTLLEMKWVLLLESCQVLWTYKTSQVINPSYFLITTSIKNRLNYYVQVLPEKPNGYLLDHARKVCETLDGSFAFVWPDFDCVTPSSLYRGIRFVNTEIAGVPIVQPQGLNYELFLQKPIQIVVDKMQAAAKYRPDRGQKRDLHRKGVR